MTDFHKYNLTPEEDQLSKRWTELEAEKEFKNDPVGLRKFQVASMKAWINLVVDDWPAIEAMEIERCGESAWNNKTQEAYYRGCDATLGLRQTQLKNAKRQAKSTYVSQKKTDGSML